MGGRKKFLKAAQKVHNTVDTYVSKVLERQKHETSAEPRKQQSFIDLLVYESSDPLFIRNQMLNIFFPFKDTLAAALSLLFFQIARKPEVWALLRGEALTKQEHLTFEALKARPYLQNVIKEGE